jgi:hypothetical protein
MAEAKTGLSKPGEDEESEEDDDYVPVDDDENAAEDDAYEALTGGDDPDDPGARVIIRTEIVVVHARQRGSAIRPRHVQRAFLPSACIPVPMC